MRIIFFPADNEGCGHYRMRMPAKALAKRGHEVAVSQNFLLADTRFDVYVFQRVTNPVAIKVMKDLRRAGKVVVHDLDDAFDCVPRWNPAHEHAKESKVVLQKAMAAATVCTFSTAELKNRYRHLSCDTAVLGNCIDPSEWYHTKPAEHLGVVIGWFGTRTHEGDLGILRGVLETIEYDYEDVCFMMSEGSQISQFNLKRLIKRPPVPVVNYPEVLPPIDIGLVPLLDNDFNRCKSAIKGIEYSITGVPFIASPLPAYERLVEHGVNGFLAKKPRQWISLLRRLIENDQLRREVGSNARDNALINYNIDTNVAAWENLYGDLAGHSGRAKVLLPA